jgi:hypothetical protein
MMGLFLMGKGQLDRAENRSSRKRLDYRQKARDHAQLEFVEV